MTDLEKIDNELAQEMVDAYLEATETESGRIMLYSNLFMKGEIKKDYKDCSEKELRNAFIKFYSKEAEIDFKEALANFNKYFLLAA